MGVPHNAAPSELGNTSCYARVRQLGSYRNSVAFAVSYRGSGPCPTSPPPSTNTAGMGRTMPGGTKSGSPCDGGFVSCFWRYGRPPRVGGDRRKWPLTLRRPPPFSFRSAEEDKCLERALAQCEDAFLSGHWHRIGSSVPSKSVEECRLRFEQLEVCSWGMLSFLCVLGGGRAAESPFGSAASFPLTHGTWA